MRIKYSLIPDDIRQQYGLDKKVSQDGYIYVCIKTGMYGLKEAAILAYQQLSDFMHKYGYKYVPGTSGLWTHTTRKTAFCLCVDDIAIKYYNNDDLQHLLQSLQNHYQCHIDWKGEHYMGMTMSW